MKTLAIGIALCAYLALVQSQDPQCPLLECLPGWRAGCLVDDQQCQCFCVKGENPCTFIIHNFQNTCAADQFMDCNLDVSPCKCRCGSWYFGGSLDYNADDIVLLADNPVNHQGLANAPLYGATCLTLTFHKDIKGNMVVVDISKDFTPVLYKLVLIVMKCT